MKKLIFVLLVLSLIAIPLLTVEAQEKRTRQYTPIIKTGAYTSAQTNAILWDPAPVSHLVMDSFIISSDTNQEVELLASSTIVTVHVGASRPVVSPGGFLWKSPAGEQIVVNSEIGDLEITLTGWEESN